MVTTEIAARVITVAAAAASLEIWQGHSRASAVSLLGLTAAQQIGFFLTAIIETIRWGTYTGIQGSFHDDTVLCYLGATAAFIATVAAVGILVYPRYKQVNLKFSDSEVSERRISIGVKIVMIVFAIISVALTAWLSSFYSHAIELLVSSPIRQSGDQAARIAAWMPAASCFGVLFATGIAAFDRAPIQAILPFAVLLTLVGRSFFLLLPAPPGLVDPIAYVACTTSVAFIAVLLPGILLTLQAQGIHVTNALTGILSALLQGCLIGAPVLTGVLREAGGYRYGGRSFVYADILAAGGLLLLLIVWITVGLRLAKRGPAHAGP